MTIILFVLALIGTITTISFVVLFGLVKVIGILFAVLWWLFKLAVVITALYYLVYHFWKFMLK